MHDFAMGAGGHVVHGFVHHAGLDRHRGFAGRGGTSVVVLRSQDGGKRCDLALAIAVVGPRSRQPRAQFLQDWHRHDRGSVIELGKAGKVPLVEIRVAKQADPHGRRREEGGDGLLLAQPQDRLGCGRLDQQGGGPEQQLRHGEHMHLRRMVERQCRQRPILPLEVELQRAGHVFRQQRPMGHHRALRGGRGSRGVEELNEVVLIHRQQVEPRIRRAGGGCQYVESIAAVQRSNELDARRFRDLRGQRRQRRIMEHRRGTGLAEQVIQLRRGQRIVHGNMNQPRPRAGKPEDEVGIGIAPERCDPFPARQSGGDQRARGRVHRAQQLVIAPAPGAETQGEPFAVPAGRAAERVVDRVAPGERAGTGIVGHVFLLVTRVPVGPPSRAVLRRAMPVLPSCRVPGIPASSRAVALPLGSYWSPLVSRTRADWAHMRNYWAMPHFSAIFW